jgi:hypothetical protein
MEPLILISINVTNPEHCFISMTVKVIRTRLVVEQDQHYFGMLDLDPHYSERLDPDPKPDLLKVKIHELSNLELDRWTVCILMVADSLVLTGNRIRISTAYGTANTVRPDPH